MKYRQPFDGEYPITQKYGEKITSDFHTGIDYGCPIGTPILASADGYVMKSGFDNTGYGYCVIIQHTANKSTLYAHLSMLCVSVGAKVNQSHVIGYSGTTGNSTGPHLHFEARKVWNDYKSYFDPLELPLMSMMTAKPSRSSSTDNDESAAVHLLDAPGIVEINAPLGAKAFYNANFGEWTPYPQGSKFYFSGETVRHNGYTYCQCYPLNFPVWIAVHDDETQILQEIS